MKASRQSLQGSPCQVVETTFGISSPSMPGMNFRQSRRVTKRGAGAEKRTRTLIEALFVSLALISLLLTGCAGDMTTGSTGDFVRHPIVLSGGDATLPASADLPAPASRDDARSAGEASSPSAEGATAAAAGIGTPKTILQTAFENAVLQKRVRTVTDWLKFMNQQHTDALITTSMKRVATGKSIGALRLDAVAERPDLPVHELMLWRQLLLTDASANTPDVGMRLESLAVMLAAARSPEDVVDADRYLQFGYTE